MKQKHLAVALSAIFAAAALTGCGSDNDNNYTPPVVTPPVVTPPVVTPPVTGTEDNVGDAASGITDLNKKATVGGQQYKRGAGANFDKTLNSNASNNGNETVLNSKTLQNTKLDNILVGRETVERLGQTDPDVALRLAGEAVDNFSDNTSNQTLTLQQYNAGGTNTITRTTPNFAPSTTPGNTTYYASANSPVQQGTGNLTFNYNPAVAAGTGTNTAVTTTPTTIPLFDSNGAPLLDAGAASAADKLRPLYLTSGTSAPVTITGNNIQVNTDLTAAVGGVRNGAGTQQEAGLVTVDRDNATGIYAVKGQEDQTGARNTVTVDGSTKTTRFFGKNYRDTANSGNNSYAFTKSVNDKNLYGALAASDLKAIKLANVQYGRVTSNIDKLQPVATIGKDGTIYYQSEISSTGARLPNGPSNQVDTYFYRGTNETSTTDMGKFFDSKANIDKGTVSYAGHAVMYGIDNSYHGNKGNPDTNAPGNAETPLTSFGNLVQANVDINKREIKGSVFNVWNLSNGVAGGVNRKDDLVTFTGKINGNTAKGESQLAYGSKDKGAFKGSFFGPNAEEFGGSVNSIDDGLYGKAAWGGVFGTQKVEGPAIVDGNANQTE